MGLRIALAEVEGLPDRDAESGVKPRVGSRVIWAPLQLAPSTAQRYRRFRPKPIIATLRDHSRPLGAPSHKSRTSSAESRFGNDRSGVDLTGSPCRRPTTAICVRRDKAALSSGCEPLATANYSRYRRFSQRPTRPQFVQKSLRATVRTEHGVSFSLKSKRPYVSAHPLMPLELTSPARARCWPRKKKMSLGPAVNSVRGLAFGETCQSRPYTEWPLSAQLARPMQRSAMSAIRRERPSPLLKNRTHNNCKFGGCAVARVAPASGGLGSGRGSCAFRAPRS